MQSIRFKNKEYIVLELFSKDKFRVQRKKKQFIIQTFNTLAALKSFVRNKKILKRNKIEMNKVLKVDKKDLSVLLEYIVGEKLTKIIALNLLGDEDYTELFRIYRNNRFAKLLLNYHPQYFIKKGKYFYYVSDEFKEYKEDDAFERGDDILLWFNNYTQKDYIESLGLKYVDRNLYQGNGEINKQIALICARYW